MKGEFYGILYIRDGYPLRGIISVSDLYEIYDNNFNY